MTGMEHGNEGAALSPYALTVESLDTPMGLDTALPRFSWKLKSSRRGAAQSAYRIRVARDQRALSEGETLEWDSGRVPGNAGILIPWGGRPLQSDTRYHWEVTTWDEAGSQSGQATSSFETGLLHRDEWQASWIGRDARFSPVVEPPTDSDRTASTGSCGPPMQLRREFTLADEPVRARLRATARGVYEARLNGTRVGDHELAPGWTEYNERIQYQTFDVTDQLHAGTNVLAAVVGDGWWCGYVGFISKRPGAHYGSAPEFLAQLTVDFADGSQAIVVTDESWVEAPGEIQYSDMLMGEYVDSRQRSDWDVSGSADSARFRPVAATGLDSTSLIAQSDEPIRVTKELHPKSISTIDERRLLVDFGQNLVGRIRLRIHGAEPGRRIQIRHAEILDGQELYTENLRRAEATDIYICSGAEVEEFEPKFTFHGFRFAEISNVPGELHEDDVTARVLHNDFAFTGSFTCSDPLVSQLQSNITWGQRGNFLAVPTDCPQRDERLGWLADAQIFTPTALRNADARAFLSRWMKDVVLGVDSDGAFRDVAPIMSLSREGAPAWGDAGVIIPWELYRAYGDRRVLEDSFEAMAGWVEHILRHNPDLLWRNRTGNSYGDWLQVDETTPRDVLSTAYFARSASLVAKAARVLGREADYANYLQLHDRIRQAFIEAYVDEEGKVQGDTQTGYLLALGFDLLPENRIAAAVERLAEKIIKRGNRLTTGFVGVSLLCPVLSEHGRADLAYALLLQEEYPSWGYSINSGATTIWERWDGWTEHAGFQSPAMNSFNHYSLGSVGDWLYGRVAGLDQAPDSVAYERLTLRPTPGGGLTWAAASQETPRGPAAIAWQLRDTSLEVSVTIPPGASARLILPTQEAASVAEGGRPITDQQGILGSERTPSGIELELSSGSYEFEVMESTL